MSPVDGHPASPADVRLGDLAGMNGGVVWAMIELWISPIRHDSGRYGICVLGHVRGVVALVAVVALLAGCTGQEQYGTVPTGSWSPGASESVSPTPSASPSLSEDEHIMAQLRKFWTDALPKAYAAPAAQRRAILEPVTMEPQLSQLLRNMSAQDKEGYRVYGVDKIITASVEEKQDGIVLIDTCLDSTQTGLVEIKTGKKSDQGPAENPIKVNLKRAPDGVWRVSFIELQKGTRC